MLLSAEADWEAVPLSTSIGVAVTLCMCVHMSTISQDSIVDQWGVMEALRVELGSVLVSVAGGGAGQRLGTGRGRGMNMGWGGHVEKRREPGVYTHLSARYGVHC